MAPFHTIVPGRMVNVLVTGGAGFIGSNFVRYAIDVHADWLVTTLDKLTYAGRLENLQDLLEHPRHRFVQGDITDAVVTTKLVHEAEIIVHFAAETHTSTGRYRTPENSSTLTSMERLSCLMQHVKPLSYDVLFKFQLTKSTEVSRMVAVKKRTNYDRGTPTQQVKPAQTVLPTVTGLRMECQQSLPAPQTITELSNIQRKSFPCSSRMLWKVSHYHCTATVKTYVTGFMC